MKHNYAFFIVPLIGVAFLLLAYSSGSPGGKSNSPGDMGANCTDCHTGNPIAATDWISSNVPVTGYIPGNTYTITLNGSHSGVVKFGFEVTAENGNNEKAGTFVLTDNEQTKFTNGGVAVTHTSDGNTPSGGEKTWTVDWTAPEAGTGSIGFYASFNAANGNGNTSGDVIYTTSLFVNEMSVGIEELSFADLNIYPNPSNGTVNIELKENARVEVWDIAGNMIENYQFSQGTNQINLSGHPAGFYFIHFWNDQKHEMKKVVLR